MINLYNIQVSETGSPTEPVSLADIKAWLKIDFADDDALLTSMNTGAREDIEQELNVKLVASTAFFYMKTTNDLEELSVFPWVMNLSQASGVVVSLLEDGETDEVQTVNEDYYLNGSLKIGSSATHKVAYMVTPVVPTAIKEAIKMLVAYRYNNRGDQEKQMGIPADIESKISRFRQIWL